ncbi:MAG TPA: hypothetical protein VJ824_00035 [Bacillota bacterium]|nr:hypothetical protein [Bacillota bacterium]
MAIVDLREVFAHCEYPYYKDVVIEDKRYHCTLYSVSIPYKTTITLPLLNFDAIAHLISIEIIKLRSQEFIHYKQAMMNQMV